MRHPPQRAKTTEVLEWKSGSERHVLDDLAGEEPLEIRVSGAPISVTMRTPGDDFELAVGFLYAEGVIDSRGDIERIAFACGPDGQPSGNVVDIRLANGASLDISRVQRHFYTASSCGVCGKTSIDAVRARDVPALESTLTIEPEVLVRLPDALRSAQRVFGKTGGLHAAALFDPAGGLIAIREDIGRHNAVDKIVGQALLDAGLPLSNRILFVSGRGGFEIVQKAVVAGVPIVASVSAPSTLAVQLARDARLTLVGFVRGRRFVVYSGEWRVTTGRVTREGR
jgi:FdhD protein